MIPDPCYAASTSIPTPTPLSEVHLAFSSTYDLLDRLNVVINMAIGDEPPSPAGTADGRTTSQYNGTLGDISNSAVSVRERVQYAQRRLDTLQRALITNT